MLLIFDSIFRDILPKEFYDDLKLLVFALHVGERRASYSIGKFRTTKSIQLKSSEKNQLKQLYSMENIQAYYLCEYEKIQYSSYQWHQSRFDTAILFRKTILKNYNLQLLINLLFVNSQKNNYLLKFMN
jgi:hypothetical protein